MALLHLWCIIGVILQRTVNGQQLVSQSKPITSSSKHKTWSADKAVDGDKRRNPNDCECCAATTEEIEPWYKLDLQQTYMVQRINVIGRSQYQNLREMEIKLGTTSEGGTVLTKNTANVFTYDYTLPSPQLGRYVTLTLRGITQYFVICELEVYAECSGNTYGNPCVPCGNCLNDDPCDKTDGSCQLCAAGYQGSKCDQHCNTYMYGPKCAFGCGQCENGVTCNNVDGMCAGCKTGYMAPMCKDCSKSYYGNTCNERCYCAVGSCDTSTGVCPAGGCTAGYKGNKCDTQCDSKMWGKDCLEACGNCLNGVHCNVFNGRCPGNCSAGYKGELCTEPCEDGKYGPNCMLNCGNCLNNATCDKQDGRCTSCAAGYKVDKCLETCNRFTYGVDCKEPCGNCSNNVPCNHVNGSCPAGCSAGVKGELCKTPCGNGSYGRDCLMSCGNCLGGETCNAETGICGNGCTEGFNGTFCNMSCPAKTFGRNCVSTCGNCFQGVACRNTNGQCEDGCEPGYKEPTCNIECDSKMWGKDCLEACGNCLNGVHCNVFNGRCPGNCSAGYKGELCTEPCEDGKYGPNCMLNCGNCLNNATCDKQDGRCTSCAAGYKVDKCLETCNRFTYGVDCKEPCGNCSNNVPCNHVNGSCPAGCSAGVKGELCKTPCGNGSYGRDCLMSCGNCLGGETCNAETGICGNGCTEGFNGTFCNMSCPAKTFGRNCVSTCGNCFQGVACRNTNGQCEDGCEPGYKEPTCNIECENGTFGRGCQQCGYCINGEPCDKLNGTCQECALGYSLHNCTLYEGQSGGPGGGGGGGSTGLIAGAVGGIIGVIVLVVVGVILYKRRSPKGKFADPKPEFSAVGNSSQPVVKKDPPVNTKPKPKVQTHNEQSTSHTQKLPPTDQETEDLYYSFLSKKTDLKMCQLWDYIHLKKREESLMFHQEFSRLANGLIKPHKTAMLADNRGKNRYKGLYAYDHTRVPLSIEAAGEVDYINASFIDGFERPKKFIASQGPISTMVVDFWRMVWQQRSGNIVMLTNIMENGTEKCMLYWPKEVGTDVTHGNIFIRLMSEKKTPDYTSRHFNISEVDGENVLPVDQFHYQAWPDKSIPDSTWSLVKFWLEVTKETSRDNVNTPIVVHCSAGIGRTGTFIAMDVAYHKAKSEGTLKMLDVVTSLREQRVNMVQTKEQYVYVHEAVADMFHFGTHFIWTSQFEEVCEYLSESDIGSRCSRLQEQYNLIVESIADRKSVQLNNGNENDEYINITILQRPAPIPVDDYRPKSKSTVYVQEARALILQNHEEKDAFIICKSPTESRMKEFWYLVKEQNVKTIISLAPQSASKKSPTLGLENKMIQENFRLSLDQKRKTSAFLETIVKMADSADDNHVVSHFEYTHWESDGNVPTDASSMIQLLEAVMDRQPRLSSTEPILVYCTNGVKQSGLVCALLSEINRINREGGHVNIIHTVKTMKERNDDVVGTFDQYQYIHDVILARIKDSTYQNQ